jgi:hypothetical protein
MTTSPKKRVIRYGVEIGEASTRSEVIAALVASGIDQARAAAEVQTFCVEGRDAFEIITPASQQKMIAETRRIAAARDG